MISNGHDGDEVTARRSKQSSLVCLQIHDVVFFHHRSERFFNVVSLGLEKREREQQQQHQPVPSSVIYIFTCLSLTSAWSMKCRERKKNAWKKYQKIISFLYPGFNILFRSVSLSTEYQMEIQKIISPHSWLFAASLRSVLLCFCSLPVMEKAFSIWWQRNEWKLDFDEFRYNCFWFVGLC